VHNFPHYYFFECTTFRSTLSWTTLQFKLDVLFFPVAGAVQSLVVHIENYNRQSSESPQMKNSTQDKTCQWYIWRIHNWAWMTAKTPLSKKPVSTLSFSKALWRHSAFIDSSSWLAFKSICYRTLKPPAVTIAQSNVLDLESACKNAAKTLNKVTSDVKDTLKRSEQGKCKTSYFRSNWWVVISKRSSAIFKRQY